MGPSEPLLGEPRPRMSAVVLGQLELTLGAVEEVGVAIMKI